jgi:membrane-associated phospholipid phosphatase
MEVSKGSNGFFDIDMGVVLDLNRNTSYKYKQKPPVAAHNWPRFIANTAASVAVGYVGKTALKGMISEERPDHSDNKSFPSGHATMAFAAARSIDKEFRSESIWIPIAGYAAATAIGVERVVSDRHHWYDVVAGAALGYGASELTWWLSDKIFPQNKNVAVTFNGNTLEARIFLDK